MPVVTAGLAVAVYTKDFRLGFYMSACLVGGYAILRSSYAELRFEMASNELRAQAPLVIPLRFPYRAELMPIADESSLQHRLDAIQPGDYLSLQRGESDGEIRIHSEEGCLGRLPERYAMAFNGVDLELFCAQLKRARRDRSGAFKLRIHIDVKNVDWFGRWSSVRMARAKQKLVDTTAKSSQDRD